MGKERRMLVLEERYHTDRLAVAKCTRYGLDSESPCYISCSNRNKSLDGFTSQSLISRDCIMIGKLSMHVIGLATMWDAGGRTHSSLLNSNDENGFV